MNNRSEPSPALTMPTGSPVNVVIGSRSITGVEAAAVRAAPGSRSHEHRSAFANLLLLITLSGASCVNKDSGHRWPPGFGHHYSILRIACLNTVLQDVECIQLFDRELLAVFREQLLRDWIDQPAFQAVCASRSIRADG